MRAFVVVATAAPVTTGAVGADVTASSVQPPAAHGFPAAAAVAAVAGNETKRGLLLAAPPERIYLKATEFSPMK